MGNARAVRAKLLLFLIKYVAFLFSSSSFRKVAIRELKQRQRQRLRERHFKIEIRVAVITSRLFLLF